jgi:mannosyltransferase
MAVSETDLGPEDPAAMVTAEPRGQAAQTAPELSEPSEPAEASGPAEPGRAGRRWSRRLVIAVPMAVSAVTGGYQIGSPSLWRDEAYTKDAIGRSAGQLVAMLGHQDAVHGAYYLLMHVVAELIGTSATALRFPSLGAMVIAAGFTAATARRAAAAGGPPAPAAGRRLDVPALTGLLAGLLFATAPYMTYYAQMARSYALETMFAVIATYLLVRAWPDGRWRWWLGYGAAVALTGLLNIFGLLILVAHGVTLLLAPARGQPAGGGRLAGGDRLADGRQLGAGQLEAGRQAGRSPGASRIPWRWVAVSVAAVAVLSPLLAVAGHQQQQISWLARPDYTAVVRLLSTMAGSKDLVFPLALLALGGLAAALLADGWRPLNPAAVALPWLVMPPLLLIAASYVKPVYYVRYVEFCLPALAIVAGAGLTALIRLAVRRPLRQPHPAGPSLASHSLASHSRAGRSWASRSRIGRSRAGRSRAGRSWGWGWTWLPAALVIAVLAALLAGPQQAIRQDAARPDNLRKAAAIVAAREQPGDIVFYIPGTMRVLGTGYPAPFLRLRDIAAGRSAIASATLTGTEITRPAELRSRFTDVRRVWVVTGASDYKFPEPATRMGKAKLALLAAAGLHVIARWQADEVMLTLYGS